MSLTNQDIQKIASLARLEISESETPHYAEQLSDILGYIESMNKINTDDITPLAHPLDLKQRVRKDEVTETNQREELQKTTEFHEAGLYLVPQVID